MTLGNNFTCVDRKRMAIATAILVLVFTACASGARAQKGSTTSTFSDVQLVVNPRLTSTTAWFLHVTNRPIKPFVYQERKKPVFVQQVSEESDNVFMRKKFRFGAEARAAGGYGLWQMSYGSTGAG